MIIIILGLFSKIRIVVALRIYVYLYLIRLGQGYDALEVYFAYTSPNFMLM